MTEPLNEINLGPRMTPRSRVSLFHLLGQLALLDYDMREKETFTVLNHRHFGVVTSITYSNKMSFA